MSAPGTRPPSPFFVRDRDPGRTGDHPERQVDDGPNPTCRKIPPTARSPSDRATVSDVNWRVLTTVRDGTTTTIGVRLTDNEQTVDDLVGLQTRHRPWLSLLILGGRSVFPWFVGASVRLSKWRKTAAGHCRRRPSSTCFRSAMTAPRSGRLSVGAQRNARADSARICRDRGFGGIGPGVSEEKMRRFVGDASHEFAHTLDDYSWVRPSCIAQGRHD